LPPNSVTLDDLECLNRGFYDNKLINLSNYNLYIHCCWCFGNRCCLCRNDCPPDVTVVDSK